MMIEETLSCHHNLEIAWQGTTEPQCPCPDGMYVVVCVYETMHVTPTCGNCKS